MLGMIAAVLIVFMAIRTFRVSRNDRFHSRRPSCGRDFTRGAFHARPNSKRVGPQSTTDQSRATSRAELPV